MPTKDSVIIPVNRGKMWWLAVGCVLFIVLGFCFVLNPWSLQSPLLHNILFIRILGFISLILFGYYLGIYISKLSEHRSGLIIDAVGIEDDSTDVSVGLIRWEDIIDIQRKVVASNKFFIVKVKDPENYIYRAKGKGKKRALQANLKFYGTPVTLSPSTLKCKFKELKQVLDKSFQKYKPKTTPES